MFLNNLFFKSKCFICSRFSNKTICNSCVNQIHKIPNIHCNICKSVSIKDNVCLECLKINPVFKKLITVGIYNGLIKTLIYDYKYQGIKKLYEPLSYLLIEEVKKELDFKIDIITSIPLSKEKILSRGFNQSELIARETSKKLKIQYIDLFERVRDTKAQFSLTAEERKENLKNAFLLKTKKLENKEILIIDDIFTTGSTIQEVSSLLLPYTKEIYIATLARTLL
ncbi:MAG: ComF family protein [Candidatus Sericytochromatia bacterium]